MAVIRCPNCGKPNPDFLEACQYCDQPLQAGAPAPGPAASTSTEEKKAGTVLCPNCGKPNPAFLDACQFCDQPLPSGASAPPSPAPSAAQPAAEDMPDWLRSFQQPAEAAAEPFGEAAPSVAERTPDWLKGMESPATPAAGAVSPFGEAAPAEPVDEDMPDWLKAMHTGSLTTAPSTTESAPARDVPDWLRGMSEPAAPETPAAEPAGDMPDWLKTLSTGALTGAPSSAEAAAPLGETSDWLKDMGAAEAETPFTPPAEESSPSWLSAAPTPAGELPDWLKKATGELHPIDEAEAPEWLQTPAAPTAAPEETSAPDWMKGFGDETPSTPSAPPALSAEAPLPAILPGLGDTDLVTGLGAAAGEELPAVEDESPDWLKSLGLPTAEPTEPAVSAGEAEPDWMKTLRSESVPPPPMGTGSLGRMLEEAPAAEPAEEPDWLSALRSEAPAAEPTESPISPFGSGTAPFTHEAPAASAAPDWLSALRPSAPAEMPEEPESAPPLDISQADMPSWLRAMRPVEVARPGSIEAEVDNYEEPVGVLAGMRGILRAEPVVVLPGKTATRVHTLTVTDGQSKQAALLARLLKSDTEAAPAAKRKARITIPWERWLITLFIFLVVALIPFGLPGLFTVPVSIRPETLAAFTALDSLPVSKPVLVAFDYEPAQAGELEPVASALITHLARKGAPLVGISTSPMGAVLAEAMFDNIAATYRYTDTLINLGYLPGGPIGLAQFALAPRAAIVSDYNGRSAINDVALWDQPILASVTTLNDFGAVVLISAAPESARAWLEQTRAAAPKVSFIVGVSAGAEPLVRPYYEAESAPIAGLVSGYAGAAQYQTQAGLGPNFVGDTDNLLLRWEAMGIGLFVTVLLMVFGNLIHLALGVWRRRKG